MKNKITIDNLNPLQVEILDELWKMKSQEEYLLWFSLQDEAIQTESYTLMTLLNLEMLEEQLPAYQSAGESVIKNIMERK